MKDEMLQPFHITEKMRNLKTIEYFQNMFTKIFIYIQQSIIKRKHQTCGAKTVIY